MKINSIETGKFRICREKKGVFGKPLSEHRDKQEALKALSEIQKEAEWNYYCVKEVVFQGSLFDEYHNPIDSAPTWIRI